MRMYVRGSSKVTKYADYEEASIACHVGGCVIRAILTSGTVNFQVRRRSRGCVVDDVVAVGVQRLH